MSVRVVIPIESPEGGGSKEFIVSDSMEDVMEKITPLQAPSSALENRTRCTFTDAETGGLIVIPQLQAIMYAEEVES